MKKISMYRMGLVMFTVVAFLGAFNKLTAQKKTEVAMKKKVLFVVTSHEDLGNTGKKTGYYLSEVTHPWKILTDAGYEIDFVSPQGGKAPVDGFKMDDAINKEFWENDKYRNKVENTFTPAQIDPEHYAAIHYAGGHGTMWDFPNNAEIADLAREIYENNGIVSAVCHGPSGLVNIKLSTGEFLVNGKRVNAFTNQEEVAVNYDDVVPFLLEDKLIDRGAIFEKSGLWQEHVTVDDRLVTGQNPASAKALGQAVLELLTYTSFSDLIIPSTDINNHVQFVSPAALLTNEAPENRAMRTLLNASLTGQELSDAKVAILVTDGVEEIELTYVHRILKDRGATVDIVSPRRATYPPKFGAFVPPVREHYISTVNWVQNANLVKIDKFIDEVSETDYDLLIIPGGAWNPDGLRGNQEALELVKAFDAKKKNIASICHGPQVLINADVVRGKETTAWWSMMIDLTNAGSVVKDQPVVVSKNLITSRGPIDLAEFSQAIIDALMSVEAN